MAFSKVSGSQIVGIQSVIPHTREDNMELNLIPEADRETLVHHTGIRFRRIASPNQNVQDLFQSAIEKLLHKLDWDSNTIDVLICVTQTPSMVIPSVSNRIHGNLNLNPQALCFDLIAGCSGFVYGLQTVQSILSSISKENKRAILCCGDISSRLIDSNDKSVKPIFSDAVSAIAVENCANSAEITGYFNLQTEGKGQHAIEMKNEDLNNSFMRLNGIDVFNYSVNLVPKNIVQLLEFAGKEIHFPDLFVFHQANKLITESIRRKLKISVEKVPYSMYEYGNTASASIPLTLNTTWENRISTNSWIVVSGFGVGFSMASGLIRFDPKICGLPEEV